MSFLKKSDKRKKDNSSPFLDSQQKISNINERIIASKNWWQIVSVSCLIITLTSLCGMIYFATQSKYIPYIVQVDKLNNIQAAGVAKPTTVADPLLLKSIVSSFISDARLVTPDVTLQKRAIWRIYAHLNSADPATTKMNEWLNGSPEKTPFARSKKEMVSIEVTSILMESDNTYLVHWVEKTRDRTGNYVKQPENFRGSFTLYKAEYLNDDESIIDNPLGIFIKDFNWSKII